MDRGNRSFKGSLEADDKPFLDHGLYRGNFNLRGKNSPRFENMVTMLRHNALVLDGNVASFKVKMKPLEADAVYVDAPPSKNSPLPSRVGASGWLVKRPDGRTERYSEAEFSMYFEIVEEGE